MKAKTEVLVCDIQRFSVHDGPGIRTTVFFKGCPLACRWCQNPETIAFGNEPVYSAETCILCGDCATTCGSSAIEIRGSSLALDRSRCETCMECTEACPSGAMSPAARPYDADALLHEVSRDAHYYGEEGGLTLSGGEPLVHETFLTEFLPRAREAGLHIAAETAGHLPSEQLGRLAGLIDLFLFDLKSADEGRHKALTGRSNRLILENLKVLVSHDRRIEVRMPVVPGHNDDEDNLERTARILASLGLSSMTLLPYHRLGQGKFVKIEAPYEPIVSHPPSAEEMSAAAETIRRAGIDAKIS